MLLIHWLKDQHNHFIIVQYNKLKSRLNPGFMFAIQSGPCGPISYMESFAVTYRTLCRNFCNVLPYTVFMQSFGDMWGINLAWDKHSEPYLNVDFVRNMEPNVVDFRMLERIGSNKLKYFDGIGFRGQTNVPRYIRQIIQYL
jgi:predicted membrane-bound spermidine synthase